MLVFNNNVTFNFDLAKGFLRIHEFTIALGGTVTTVSFLNLSSWPSFTPSMGAKLVTDCPSWIVLIASRLKAWLCLL
jgi:hypothetical protein